MRDETAGPGQLRAETGLSVAPLGPDEQIARRFGQESVDGDTCFTLSRDGRLIATIRLNSREGTVRTVPAAGFAVDGAAERAAYAAAVLEYAVRHVLETGRLLDVGDPLPERLLDPIADQLASLPNREQPIVRGPFSLGALSGTVAHVGAVEAFKPGRYQVKVGLPGGQPILLSFSGAESPCHQRTVRVAPYAAAVVVGLDETTTELAGYLRGSGLDVLVAEQGAVARRDRLDELVDRGFTVLDAGDVAGTIDRLAVYAPVTLIVEGYCSDSVLDPEERLESEAQALEAANRSTVVALRERFGCPVLFKDQLRDATLFDAPARRFLRGSLIDDTGGASNGFRFLTPTEAALVSAVLPVLAPESSNGAGLRVREGSVELTVDVLLPTAVPYGARNRHSPDDVAVKVARGAEHRFLSHLDQLDPTLKARLRPVEDPELRRQRSHAVAIHQRFGPWNVHVVLEVEIRAIGQDGVPIRPADYRDLLARVGDVRLLDFDALGLDREQLLVVDGTQLQNVAFQKLGKIHHHRPTAVVVPLSDWAFKVILLVPQASGGQLNRLEAALATTGIAGDDALLVKRLAEEAVDLPRIDARLADT
ncbi:MAG TPA: hypothetical protein VNL16_00785, partial [Chloroflexota bacterium]|nr:hypothetical protein [Chloroflexota bacterium]